ncbi:MAG: ROK family protein [Peptoniphilus sp. oral taxon 375]|nr:ROK family protein [Peptoniphilus sp. oral taxon 375]
MYGAIEAGGTKFNLALANDQGKIIKEKILPTKSPQEVLDQIISFYQDHPVKALGLGLFGPVELDPKNKNFGHLLNTPKEGWRNYPFYQELNQALPQTNLVLETDVNVAGLGEYYLGNGLGKKSLLYLTVGTGIGGSYIYKGHPLQGLSHPEMGHILLRPHPKDSFSGTCPYHDYCLEGMAAGPSIYARYQELGQNLGPHHEVWTFLAYYLAQALVSYTVILRPDQITLGGGVMHSPGLLDKVKENFQASFHDYLPLPPLDDYIKTPKLKDRSGISGALLLVLDEKIKKQLILDTDLERGN